MEEDEQDEPKESQVPVRVLTLIETLMYILLPVIGNHANFTRVKRCLYIYSCQLQKEES